MHHPPLAPVPTSPTHGRLVLAAVARTTGAEPALGCAHTVLTESRSGRRTVAFPAEPETLEQPLPNPRPSLKEVVLPRAVTSSRQGPPAARGAGGRPSPGPSSALLSQAWLRASPEAAPLPSLWSKPWCFGHHWAWDQFRPLRGLSGFRAPRSSMVRGERPGLLCEWGAQSSSKGSTGDSGPARPRGAGPGDACSHR